MSLDLSLNYPDIKIGMDNTGNNANYEFDRFRLDAGKLMLYCDDVEVSMPPKMVKTLAVLVESRGTIISKDELLERVWSDTIVDESNLSQHLYHLRKVLGDLPDGRPHIETLRRRGYRFNGDVRKVEAPKIEIPSVVRTPAPVRHPHAEREGNVLRLVDWMPAQERQERRSLDEDERGVNARVPRRGSVRPALVIAAGFLLLSAVAVIAFKFRSSAMPEAPKPEILIIRLTSGIAPENATISPNGDYFAYHESIEGGERLWLQQVGHANRVSIGDAPQGRSFGSKTFSPDGKSLFYSLHEVENRNTALYRMPTIGGPQVKILDDVGDGISFSPDGNEFVFIRENKSAETTSLVIAGREGESQRTVLQRTGQARLLGFPAWSPDGKTIAFATMEADNSIGIYATDAGGTAPRRISNERWDNAYRIVWLPDGRGLVMIATRIGEGYTTRRNQVYYISYPEGTSRRLTSDGLRYQESSLGISKDEAIIAIPINRSSQIWSLASNGAAISAIQISRGLIDGRAGIAVLPDGRIGFNSRVGEDVGIWLMNADGSGLKQLPTGMLPVVEEVRSDQKGRYFVFSGYKDGFSRLYRIDAEGNNFTQLTFGDDQPIDSTISPDGTTIVYASAISGGIVHPAKLFRIPIDGGKPEQMSNVECATPHFSPSGDRLSCIRGEDLVVLGADGTEIAAHRLLPYARVNFGSKWTPDGKGLVYIRIEKGVGNLWVQPVDGGKPRRLTDFTVGDMYNYAFSSDGTRLYVARGQQVSDAILIRNYR